ncbi:MAG: GAF domain-containing protein [Armatimonadota bacterium]|nr:GAF domain-containing protein [Armatimonadota bacterium]
MSSLSAKNHKRSDTEQRISEIATIYEIGQAINQVDLAEVLRLVTEKAAAVMSAQACSLLLRDPESEQLIIEASYGLSDDIVKGARVRYGEGIAGKVALTGDPMLIHDVSKDPRFAGESILPRPDVVSSLCVPLNDEVGDTIGVLNISRHIPSPPFTQNDLKLFCIFASQAALAITNAQLYSRLNSRIQEMAIISDLLRAISSTLDLDQVLNQIADNILGIVGFDRCCVYLRDPRTDEFVASVIRGFGAEDAIEDRVRYGESVVGLAVKERIPIFARSSRLAPEDSLDESRQRQTLALPIIVRDACIGAVLVDNEISGRPIHPDSVQLLSTFVNQAGIAIENARLYEAMEQKYAEVNVLYEQSRVIGSAYGLGNAASLLVDVALRAVECDTGILLLLDERRQQLHVQCAGGVCEEVSPELRQIVSLPDAAHAVRRLRDPLVISPEQRNMLGDWAFMSGILSRYSSVGFMPLIAEDVTIGALLLGRASEKAFQSSEMKLLSIIVSHAAVVLKNAIRYEERMQDKALELSALYEFATRISSASNLEEALDSIVSIVAGLVQCDECVIYAIDHERQMAIAKAARYTKDVEPLPAEVPLAGDSMVACSIRDRAAIISPNIAEDTRFQTFRVGKNPVMSLMSIPLIVQDDVVGVLNVHSYSPNQYSEDDVRVLSIIASQSAAIYKELEALSALTSYTDSILSSIAAGVVTLDSEGMILTWNKAAEQIVGLSDNQVVGRPFKDVINDLPVAEVNKESTIQIIESVLQTGETYQAYKLCYQAKDTQTYVNLSASQLVNSSGERLGLVIIFEEVTREIEMEEQFRRMGELAAIGQLAASIAHELRNPLSSIKGAAQYLRKEYENESSIVEFLGIIIEEVNGLNKLTTEFLDFARPIQLELKPLDINSAIEKTLQLMNIDIAEHNAVLKMRLAENLPIVQADENQIVQVLRNVIINALQSMPDGGELVIETKPASGRGGVELWLYDTGVGIAPDKLDRIFIPFFTTKTKGTGLGLSVVRKIVENHGGRVIVRSQPGQGTSFGILLPIDGAIRTVIPEAEMVDRNVLPK